jgi:hypothetical protein
MAHSHLLHRFLEFFTLFCIISPFGYAFDPYVAISIRSLHVLPLGTPHSIQTELEVNDFLTSNLKVDKITSHMKQARQEIMDANAEVDDPHGYFQEKDYVPAHFDDEFFHEGQDHLMMLRGQMIEFLSQGRATEARNRFGRQLHTL